MHPSRARLEDHSAVPTLPAHRPRLRPAGSRALLACAMLAGAALAACSSLPSFMSFPAQVRGNKVDEQVLAQLVPGTSSRADVTALIGSPTAHATFDDNVWLYIAQVTRPVIASTNAVLDQQVVVLTFDQQGVLRNIDRKSQQDSVPVDVVARATPAPGNDSSFLQQLLGNVGRFSPVPVDQGSRGGQGGATNPGNF